MSRNYLNRRESVRFLIQVLMAFDRGAYGVVSVVPHVGSPYVPSNCLLPHRFGRFEMFRESKRLTSSVLRMRTPMEQHEVCGCGKGFAFTKS